MPFQRRIYQKFEEVLQPLHSSCRSSRGIVPALQTLELNASKTSCFQKLFGAKCSLGSGEGRVPTLSGSAWN